MSSTTDPRADQRGQILIIFAGGFVLILAIAALVFDVGQNLLDRRTEQNVSDAAALAGARYVHTANYTYHGGCAAAPSSGMPAVKAACDLASESGYLDGQNGRTVRIDLPPIVPSTFSGLPGYLEVQIGSTRPSFFAAVLGTANQQTGAVGVATNQSDIALPYSLLSLDPIGCGTNKINGNGAAVTTNGTVHVDSNCSSGAILLSGSGVLNAPECDVVGQIQKANNAHDNCSAAPAGVLVSGDPLANLSSPPKPPLPAAVQPLDAMPGPIPSGCPGSVNGAGVSVAATEAAPAACAFTSGNAITGKSYRIFPGYYPGGIQTTRSILYMSPGLYWIGGSGITVKTTAGQSGFLISKNLDDNTGVNPTGGVLIYNTADPVVAAGCPGSLSPGCYGPITMDGGSGAVIALLPIQTGTYKGMTIFVDRAAAVTSAVDVDLSGGGANLSITGTIYAPTGSFTFNGGGTAAAMSAQVICYNFQVNGNGASITMNYDPANLFHVTGVGLVQ